jgi:hypothetical protein
MLNAKEKAGPSRAIRSVARDNVTTTHGPTSRANACQHLVATPLTVLEQAAGREAG